MVSPETYLVLVQRSRQAPQEAAAIWAVLARFDGIAEWAPKVTHSVLTTEKSAGLGMARRVQVGRQALIETVTRWEPNRLLAYAIEGLPPIVAGVTNRWELEPGPAGTTVTLTSEIDTGATIKGKLGAQVLRVPLAKASDSMLDGLLAHVAAGGAVMVTRPDIIVILTDEERAAPPYESAELAAWREQTLTGNQWFHRHGVSFERHYTGSLACVPSRPTLFTGHYPDVHGVTQTDGLGKMADDTRMRWLRPGEVPTLGNWFLAAGYDTHYDGKWHISHADLTDPVTGKALATNDDHGVVDPYAVAAYLDADPLAPFGFGGWVGPEPHGAALADSGTRRDPLIADRVVTWLKDRYARRAAGEKAAARPFLLVASFVNPHDIVLFPGWQRRSPLGPSRLDPPHVPESPTRHESLADKPAAQVAFRQAYYTGYGAAPAVAGVYGRRDQAYRDLYYRLHAEVDGPIDRVRRAVTQGGSTNAVLVRSSDHGDLLGSHGGLHQKWFNLYDEATRVPFLIARIGKGATSPATVRRTPTSHVDLVPTLLAAAGIDEAAVAEQLRTTFTEVHPLPGRSLWGLVDEGEGDGSTRAVYIQTRDNMLEGDAGASAMARILGRTHNPPLPMRIAVPAHVGSNFEGVVAQVPEATVAGGCDHLWKLVRTFDDPATWTEPGVRHLAADGPGGDVFRTVALADEWELYDLDEDPNEAANRRGDAAAAGVFDHLKERLVMERHAAVPQRNNPWPYVTRAPGAHRTERTLARR